MRCPKLWRSFHLGTVRLAVRCFLFPILLNDLTLKYMKKAFFFLCMACGLVACTPTTPTTNSGADSTKVDGTAVVVQDSTPVVDSVATPSDAVVDAGTTTDPVNTKGEVKPIENTGRQANPNVDMNAKRFKVTGHFLVQGSYCGGAAPSPEMEAAAREPKPMSNQAFLIRKGKTNALGTDLVTRVRTDASGNFSVELTPGTYCMVLEEKESRRSTEFLKTPFYTIDTKCDDKWLSTCDVSFTVADKPVSGLRKTFEKKCQLATLSPCISWDGPLPPSAAPRGGNH